MAAGIANHAVPWSFEPALSAPPMGRGRIRTRPNSITTTAPCSSAAAIFGRFASRREVCCSGRRCDGRRSKITDGLVSRRSDNSVPKSVSAEISTRPSRSARVSTGARRDLVPLACSSPGHALRRGQPVLGRRQPRATMHCLREISRGAD